MSGDTLAALVGIVAALFLATRGLRGGSISRSSTLRMAGVWAIIIATLVLLIWWLGR